MLLVSIGYDAVCISELIWKFWGKLPASPGNQILVIQFISGYVTH
jgi:hypothetical protein